MRSLIAMLLAALAIPAAAAPAKPAVSLTRLDCGSVFVGGLGMFSDTGAYAGQAKTLTVSCYLIRHGDTLMLWDTGLPAALKGAPVDKSQPLSPTLARTIVEQLADIGVSPDQISLIGISHYHGDHVGQVALFPKAKLLIGKGDWDAIKATDPAAVGATTPDPSLLAPWVNGGGSVQPVSGDLDLFGDGSVVMLDMPGHTPGHHSLLVKLANKGNILLTGDVTHFTENYQTDGIPVFNTNRADSLASLDRFKKYARNVRATVIIQHESADIAKLPAFPKAAD